MLSDEEIRDCVAVDETKDAEALCQDLVDLANDKGGVDNITVVIVRIPNAKTTAKADVKADVKADAKPKK